MSNSSPDVVVLGMPSSGKTVFLSVLGHKYNLTVTKGSPLGFRMHPRGPHTRQMVETSFSDLSMGKWPDSTNKGQKTDLEWDVLTGNRKLFSLSSMDISGETFLEAFGNGERNPTQGEEDALLGGETTPSTRPHTPEQLIEAVRNAKCVCLFVNIAVEQSEKQRTNFNQAMVTMCNMLDQDDSLCRKTIVVLTQTHTRTNEIDRTGGAAAFLNLDSAAHGLHVIVQDKHIPVLAVSAVNEEPNSGNQIPKDFESDGLFGFLLVVSGMVAPEFMGDLKSTYLNFVNAKANYYQNSFRPICDRVKLVRKFAEAGTAFHNSCQEYLANPSNFELANNEYEDASVTLNAYRTETENDREIVRPAQSGWRAVLDRDEAWNRQIELTARKHAEDGVDFDVEGIINAVREESGCESESFLFGFPESELNGHGGFECYKDWVEGCLAAAAKDADRKVEEGRIAAAIEKRKTNAQHAREGQQQRIRKFTLASRIAFGIALLPACIRLSAAQWDPFLSASFPWVLLAAVLGMHALIQSALVAGNRHRLADIRQALSKGRVQLALDLANRFADHPRFLVFARDFLADDFTEQLRQMVGEVPLHQKVHELYTLLSKAVATANQDGFLPSHEPAFQCLSRGEQLLNAIKAQGGPPDFPTYEDLRDGLFDFSSFEAKLLNLERELKDTTEPAQQNLASLQKLKASWQDAQEKRKSFCGQRDRIREIDRIVVKEALAKFDSAHAFRTSWECLEAALAAKVDEEIPAFAKVSNGEVDIDSIVRRLEQHLEEVTASAAKAELALADTRDERDWRQFHQKVPDLQDALVQAQNKVQSANDLREKSIQARICEDAALKLQEKAAAFMDAHPNSSHRAEAEQIDQNAKGTVMTLPKLVRIDAFLKQSSTPVNIKDKIWFGIGLPPVQSADNPDNRVNSIFMEIPTESPKQLYKLPASVDGGPKQEITVPTAGLKHGLNVVKLEF